MAQAVQQGDSPRAQSECGRARLGARRRWRAHRALAHCARRRFDNEDYGQLRALLGPPRSGGAIFHNPSLSLTVPPAAIRRGRTVIVATAVQRGGLSTSAVQHGAMLALASSVTCGKSRRRRSEVRGRLRAPKVRAAVCAASGQPMGTARQRHCPNRAAHQSRRDSAGGRHESHQSPYVPWQRICCSFGMWSSVSQSRHMIASSSVRPSLPSSRVARSSAGLPLSFDTMLIARAMLALPNSFDHSAGSMRCGSSIARSRSASILSLIFSSLVAKVEAPLVIVHCFVVHGLFHPAKDALLQCDNIARQ